MNANSTSGFPAWAFRIALAIGLLAPGLVLAEVGVAIESGPSGPVAPLAVYILDGSTEDPTPINPVWRRIGLGGVRFALNSEGESNGDGMPSILTNTSTGLVAAAWSRNSASGYDIVVSRFVGGAWTIAQVAAATSANELDPQIVLDPDGSVHLFYWIDGATPQVFHIVAPADLSSWSTPVPISQPGQSACRPAGAFYNGVLHVAYEVNNFGNGNTPRQVVLGRFESGVFTTEVVAMTNNLGKVSPQVHSHAGRLWVDWVDYETTGGDGEIAWTRMNAQGQWDVIRYESFADHVEREYRTRAGVRVEVFQ